MGNIHNITNLASLETADKIISVEDDIDVERLYAGIRLAKLTLFEEMTVILIEIGYTSGEIADYRKVAKSAVYNMQRTILKKTRECPTK